MCDTKQPMSKTKHQPTSLRSNEVNGEHADYGPDKLPTISCSSTKPTVVHPKPDVSASFASADRHQGWHTEFDLSSQMKWKRARAATDYVVQTSFLKDPQTNFKNNNSREKERVNLVLRFKSLLPRRRQSHAGTDLRTHRMQSEKSPDNDKIKRPSQVGVKIPGRLAETSPDADACTVKRSSSDSCLQRNDCHLHIRMNEAHLSIAQSSSSPSAVSPSSENTSDVFPSENHREWNRRMQSLSTGNICCLFALRCLPSVEFLTTPLNHPSPLVRRRSLPVSSLKPPSEHDTGYTRQFALDLLRNHPCYQDVHRKLNGWLRQTMDYATNKGIDHQSTGNWANDDIENSIDCCRHVRFADEATCSSSATTLNSLSASSSARSLTSLALTPASCSPQGSTTQLPVMSHPISSNYLAPPCIHPVRHHSPATRQSKRFFQRLSPKGNDSTTANSSNASGSVPVRADKSPSLSRRLWNRKKQKRRREGKTTPLVTVNVIQDYSEPPEVPTHVLKELRLQEYSPRWKNLFPNPEECVDFEQRLARQHVCLARLLSRNLANLHVEVHVVTLNPFGPNGSTGVRLRFTLNNWATWAETRALKKVHFEKRRLSVCETQWVEIYTGDLELHVDSEPESDWVTDFGRFEFAVVARCDGREWWDNNSEQNYTCLSESIDE